MYNMKNNVNNKSNDNVKDSIKDIIKYKLRDNVRLTIPFSRVTSCFRIITKNVTEAAAVVSVVDINLHELSVASGLFLPPRCA